MTNFAANLFSPNNFKNNEKVILNCLLWIETNMRMVKTLNHATINMYPQLDGQKPL